MRKLIRGRIHYTSNQPDRLGAERGREFFTLVQHGDGRKSLTAFCEIDDAPMVTRQVTLSLDSDGRPTDGTVRLNVDDKFMGTGWFRFTQTQAECEVWTAREGRIHQRFELAEPVLAFGTHPITGDGLNLMAYDLTQGPGRQFFPNMMLSSPDHRGATGPMLFPLGFGIEYVGTERITIAVGEFDALHFRYVDTAGQLPEEHPRYDVWCAADGSYLFLKGEVGGYMQTRYELTELERWD